MPADQTIDFVVLFLVTGLLVLGLGSMLLGWLANTWDRFVNRSQLVMSREQPSEAAYAALPVQTRLDQTPDRPMIPKPTPDQLLTIFKLMRAHGIRRDDARAVFQAAGLPVDSNLWSKAAPPTAVVDGPAHVTPIAGRATDADFPYQELV
jgi:hypothetical protein